MHCAGVSALNSEKVIADMDSSVFRGDGRAANALRPVKMTPGFVATAEGSVLIEVGHTRVLCNATIEQGVPGWMRNSGRGWVTAE